MVAHISRVAYELLRLKIPTPLAFTTRETDLKFGVSAVRHALDYQGHLALLVPLSHEEVDRADTRSKGIRIDTTSLDLGPAPTRYLVLRCVDPALEAQFLLLVDDIVRALETRPELPGAACIDVLERWRSLFEPVTERMLSMPAQVGLLAELHLLEELLRVSPDQALATWHGPDRSRHDFVTEAAAVEVKATTVRGTFPVSIHGDRQLDAPPDKPLFLFAEQMEASPGGDSISEAVSRILALTHDRAELLKKLALVGFHLTDAAAYATCQFSTLRSKLCLIDDHFPRISRFTMRDPGALDEIGNLQYTVDIANISSHTEDSLALLESARILAA